MRKTLMLLLLTVAVGASAQGRFCRSMEEYKAGKWTEAPGLKAVFHSASRKVWVGGNDYKFTTGDKALDKTLRKEALVVEYQDTLYVNLRTLRYVKSRFGNGYAQAMPYAGDGLLFVTHRIGPAVRGKEVMAGMMFGAIGAAVVGTKDMNDRVCYLVGDSTDGKTIAVSIVDDDFMEKLLGGDPRLLDDYKSEKKERLREAADRVLPILREKGLVR